MKNIIRSLILTAMCLGSSPLLSQHDEGRYVPDPDPLVNQRLEEWQDLKFGLLMHWGAYSQWGIVESWSLCPEDYGWTQRTAGNHSDNYFEYVQEYENLKTTFNPTEFDPEKWAKAARDAGMKYVVFTTKHHDGFSMFDTQQTDYKITDPDCPFSTNPRANVTKEIFNAFRAEDMWAGAYFSKPDWNHDNYWDPYFPPRDRNVNYDPELYPEKWEKYVQFTHNQIMELLTDYGKVDILWLDGGWVTKVSQEEAVHFAENMARDSGSGFIKHTTVNQDIRMDELVEKARKAQPGIIVVDRAVPGKNQNYLTPENRVPEAALPYPWESCIISGGSWSWIPDAKYMSGREAVQMLVDIVAKGGNLLLNIAPGPDGRWDDGAYKMLEEIGEWMDVNSEAIYETRAIAPYKEGNVALTSKEDAVYAIFMTEDENSEVPAEIRLGSVRPQRNARVTLLESGARLKWKRDDDGILITIPSKQRAKLKVEHTWVIKIDGVE